jgi:hypothetical protein
MWLADSSHRHEIAYFGNAVLREKARYEDIRIRQVELLVPHLIENWMDLEATAFMLVEQAGENCRRIEARKAHEVN